ncbi:S8 family peptidase [Cellulomonas sp. ICMP 17802]|uniref:S8 family peptidase n=1 Tax=Cellulomonas sp. ICMP 17802 TaxID=3239199 RepID=UPI00351B8E01
MRLPARACGAVLVLLGLVAASATGAAAADDPIREQGLWYVNQAGLADIHQRTTGAGVTVAVIDSPINPGISDLVGTDLTVHEPSYCAATEGGAALPASTTDPSAEHGTAMAAILVGTGAGVGGEPGTLGVAPGVHLLHYAAVTGIDDGDGGRTTTCYPPAGVDGSPIRQAVDDGATIISMSITEADMDWSDIAYAHQHGAIVVAAAPHDGGVGLRAPASGNGVVAVESIGPDGRLAAGNNTDPRLTVTAPGEYFATTVPDDGWSVYHYTSGSSNATAYTAGALALVWSAYPTATANQLIQTLVRNTDGEEHELRHDDAWGYGAVNVRQMLEHDPTTYPDENPLLTDDPDVRPSLAEIDGAATAAPTSAATSDPAAEPAAGGTGGPSTPLLVGGAVALLLVAGVVVAVLAARRRAAAPPPAT